VEGERLVRENAAKIVAKNDLIALKDQIIHRQELVNRMTTSLIVMSLSFLGLVIYNYLQKKRLNARLEHKVEERTSALHLSAARIKRRQEEISLLLDRNSREIANVSSTLKGLCSTGLKEVWDPLGRSYLLKIHAAANSFAKIYERTTQHGLDCMVAISRL
jgi:hypothetical protein